MAQDEAFEHALILLRSDWILTMSEDEFTKQFKYIEEFRADVKKRFEEASTDRVDIRGAISELSA